MASAPYMSSADPIPISAKPDVSRARRNANHFDLWRWRGDRYNGAFIRRSRGDDAATERQSREDNGGPYARLSAFSVHQAFSIAI
jgi:hypothetical protein